MPRTLPPLLSALEQLKDKLGRLSVVVYNVAGLGLGAKDPLELSWDDLVQHLKFGPGGGLVVVQWAAREMKELKGKKSVSYSTGGLETRDELTLESVLQVLFTGGGVAHEVVPGLAGLGIEKSALLNLTNNFNTVLKPQGGLVPSSCSLF